MAFTPVAVVGRGCVLPGALTPAELWSLVVEGRSAVSKVPADLWRVGPRADRGKLAQEIASDTGGYVSGPGASTTPPGPSHTPKKRPLRGRRG